MRMLGPDDSPRRPATDIVITIPSSPECEPSTRKPSIPLPPSRAAAIWNQIEGVSRSAPSNTPLHFGDQLGLPGQTTTPSHFETLLLASDLPPPGPDYYAARRALWRAPGPNPPAPTQPTPSRFRLETLLARPSALESDEAWDAGLGNIWRGLIGGGRLKHRLPLGLVLKILQTGWIHDGTWPKGATVPETDEDPPEEPSLQDGHDLQPHRPPEHNPLAMLSPTTPDYPSGITTPQTPYIQPMPDGEGTAGSLGSFTTQASH